VTRVLFRWERKPSQPVAERLRRSVRRVLRRLGVHDVEIHVLITGDDRVRELNRSYRQVDAPTDVLSFPGGEDLPTGGRWLGEIIVSLDTARRQAAELGHGEVEELEELMLHGVLHLLGYDHEQDGGEMNELELTLRGELGR
jgi:probable rRNA maturation factor